MAKNEKRARYLSVVDTVHRPSPRRLPSSRTRGYINRIARLSNETGGRLREQFPTFVFLKKHARQRDTIVSTGGHARNDFLGRTRSARFYTGRVPNAVFRRPKLNLIAPFYPPGGGQRRLIVEQTVIYVPIFAIGPRHGPVRSGFTDRYACPRRKRTKYRYAPCALSPGYRRTNCRFINRVPLFTRTTCPFDERRLSFVRYRFRWTDVRARRITGDANKWTRVQVFGRTSNGVCP